MIAVHHIRTIILRAARPFAAIVAPVIARTRLAVGHWNTALEPYDELLFRRTGHDPR